MNTTKVTAVKTTQEGEIMSLVQQVINFFSSHATLIIHLMGPNANIEEIEERKKSCEECDYIDLQGNKLYRKNEKEYHFCGVPIFKKWLRDPRKEGCGCFLNLKWKKKWTECPLLRW